MGQGMKSEWTEFPALHMAVPTDLWLRVAAREEAAMTELRAMANRLVLYDHILSMGPDETWVTLDQLYEYGIIRAIRLYQEIPAT